MPTGLAYLIVVLVWATTPLAIKWSAEALPPVMAAMSRMMIAVAIGLPWLWLQGKRLDWQRGSVMAYLAAVPGVFGAMALSYLASSYVPSGLISVMFGLAPLLSGLMMQCLPGSVRLNGWHWMGCLLGVAGLAVVFSNGLTGNGNMLIGVLLLLGAVTGFAATGILVKRQAIHMPPLQHTLGALILSLPLYGLLSFVMGEHFVLGENVMGLWAIGYLAVFGSLIGFVCYFLVLQRLSAATVSLVTLMTPVLALGLGALFNGEQPHANVVIGAAMIISALALYIFGDRRVRRAMLPA
ncbi:MAG: DMT family transporter [Alcanivoracaceae bacterium]|nr:DMT family transporter [Alcanivoracaceae bacterium]